MRRVVTIGSALGLAAVMAGCGGVVEEEETITIRVGSGNPETHDMWEHYVIPITESVTEKTDGRVVFETYAGGELVEYTNEIDAVESGVVDMAMFFPALEPDRMPMGEATLLPTGQYSSDVGTDAWLEFFYNEEPLSTGDTMYETMATNNGLELIPLQSTETYRFAGTGAQPEDLADFQNHIARVPSAIHSQLADEIGMTPITIPVTDMYDALNRGTFNGVYQAVSDWGTYGVEGLFDYVYDDLGFGAFVAAVAINEDFWADLPDDVKEAFEEAQEENLPGAVSVIEDSLAEVREANEDAGGEWISLEETAPDALEAIDEAMEPTWQSFIDRLDNAGHPGSEIAARWREAVVNAGGDVPESVLNLDLD